MQTNLNHFFRTKTIDQSSINKIPLNKQQLSIVQKIEHTKFINTIIVYGAAKTGKTSIIERVCLKKPHNCVVFGYGSTFGKDVQTLSYNSRNVFKTFKHLKTVHTVIFDDIGLFLKNNRTHNSLNDFVLNVESSFTFANHRGKKHIPHMIFALDPNIMSVSEFKKNNALFFYRRIPDEFRLSGTSYGIPTSLCTFLKNNDFAFDVKPNEHFDHGGDLISVEFKQVHKCDFNFQLIVDVLRQNSGKRCFVVAKYRFQSDKISLFLQNKKIPVFSKNTLKVGNDTESFVHVGVCTDLYKYNPRTLDVVVAVNYFDMDCSFFSKTDVSDCRIDDYFVCSRARKLVVFQNNQTTRLVNSRKRKMTNSDINWYMKKKGTKKMKTSDVFETYRDMTLSHDTDKPVRLQLDPRLRNRPMCVGEIMVATTRQMEDRNDLSLVKDIIKKTNIEIQRNQTEENETFFSDTWERLKFLTENVFGSDATSAKVSRLELDVFHPKNKQLKFQKMTNKNRGEMWDEDTVMVETMNSKTRIIGNTPISKFRNVKLTFVSNVWIANDKKAVMLKNHDVSTNTAIFEAMLMKRFGKLPQDVQIFDLQKESFVSFKEQEIQSYNAVVENMLSMTKNWIDEKHLFQI